MDKEQLLLEIAKLEVLNKQAWEVIRAYQDSIQKNLEKIDLLRAQLS